MNDLVSWLRAQLDDDEQLARSATCQVGHVVVDTWVQSPELSGDEPGRINDQLGHTVVHYEDAAPDAHQAAHIVNWDPARVLAEIDAKRRIIERYEDALSRQTDPDHSQIAADVQVCEYEDWILPALLMPYADRDGYRDEWRA